MNCQTSEHRVLKDDEQKVQNKVERKMITLGKAADKTHVSTKINQRPRGLNARWFRLAVVQLQTACGTLNARGKQRVCWCYGD